MTESLVVDASAILDLLLHPGHRGRHVFEHLSGRNLLAPEILPFEIWNALRRRRNAGLLSDPDANRARSDARNLTIDYWPHAVLEERVWELGSNLSAYDASYVALAELTNARLITCDVRLARAPGPRCEVVVVR